MNRKWTKTIKGIKINNYLKYVYLFISLFHNKIFKILSILSLYNICLLCLVWINVGVCFNADARSFQLSECVRIIWWLELNSGSDKISHLCHFKCRLTSQLDGSCNETSVRLGKNRYWNILWKFSILKTASVKSEHVPTS